VPQEEEASKSGTGEGLAASLGPRLSRAIRRHGAGQERVRRAYAHQLHAGLREATDGMRALPDFDVQRFVRAAGRAAALVADSALQLSTRLFAMDDAFTRELYDVARAAFEAEAAVALEARDARHRAAMARAEREKREALEAVRRAAAHEKATALASAAEAAKVQAAKAAGTAGPRIAALEREVEALRFRLSSAAAESLARGNALEKAKAELVEVASHEAGLLAELERRAVLLQRCQAAIEYLGGTTPTE
jgi:hypothetical protein